MQDERLLSMLTAIPQTDAGIGMDFRQINGLNLPIFAINLERRPDRWQALTQRFQAAGLDRIARMPAVDGAGLSADLVARFGEAAAESIDGSPGCHLSLTRPAIGCFLSHLSIWKTVANSGMAHALVLEDDASPSPAFNAERLGAALQYLPAEGMIFPGCTVMGGLAERQAKQGLVRVYYFNGTFAYIVSAAACDYLLRNMLPMRMHVDHQISHLLFEKRAVFEGLLMQPASLQPDWALGSDCHVDLRDEFSANRALWTRLSDCRLVLEAEGRQLMADDMSASQAA